MEIEKVEIIYFTEDKSDVPIFEIYWKGEKQTTTLPTIARDNRHWVEVKDWWTAQKKKPFKWTFDS